MSDYAEEVSNKVEGKTIEIADIDGYGIYLKFTDGTKFEYDATDGGYSEFEVEEQEK